MDEHILYTLRFNPTGATARLGGKRLAVPEGSRLCIAGQHGVTDIIGISLHQRDCTGHSRTVPNRRVIPCYLGFSADCAAATGNTGLEVPSLQERI